MCRPIYSCIFSHFVLHAGYSEPCKYVLLCACIYVFVLYFPCISQRLVVQLIIKAIVPELNIR